MEIRHDCCCNELPDRATIAISVGAKGASSTSDRSLGYEIKTEPTKTEGTTTTDEYNSVRIRIEELEKCEC